MINAPQTNTIIQNVSSFEKLMAAPFQGRINAISWIRKLEGDFEEIINALECDENRSTVHPQKLMQMHLTEQGQLAPTIILNDLKMLEEQRAAPTLNVIHNYERDEDYPFFSNRCVFLSRRPFSTTHKYYSMYLFRRFK